VELDAGSPSGMTRGRVIQLVVKLIIPTYENIPTLIKEFEIFCKY
jgi:hypothetical protein